jgi:hypothetical protein
VTCIVAKEYPRRGVVEFWCESQTTDNDLRIVDTLPKILHLDRFGFVGGVGTSSVIQSSWHLFRIARDLEALIESLRTEWKNETETASWLMHCGGLAVVGSKGDLSRPAGGFVALGSGRELAIGVLEAGGSPRRAVHVACKWDASCGEPVIGPFVQAIEKSP